MPKIEEIKKVLVIGSGPIVIGQAAEFDYAGTQACRSLKEEGVEVVLVNSNPATIMTDPHIADKIYMEPLDLEHVAKIIRYERPDGLIASMGGQTGLNLGMALAKNYKKAVLLKVMEDNLNNVEPELKALLEQYLTVNGNRTEEKKLAPQIVAGCEACGDSDCNLQDAAADAWYEHQRYGEGI